MVSPPDSYGYSLLTGCYAEHPAHMVLPMDRVDEIFEAHLHGIKQAYATHHEELSMDLR